MPFNDKQHAWIGKVIPAKARKAKPSTGTEVWGGSEDGPGPMSMHLPDPHEKPAKPKTHVIDFSAEDAAETDDGIAEGLAHSKTPGIVTPEKQQQFLAALEKIEKQAAINANGFGIAVVNAFLDFQRASKSRVAELKEKNEHAKELAGAIVSGLLGLVGGALVTKVTEEGMKVVADQIKDAFKEQMVNQVKAAASAGSDLDAGLDAVAQGFRDYADAVKDNVDSVIGPYKVAADAAIKSGKMPLKQSAALLPFVGATTAALDDLIYAWCGIPGPAKAKDIRMQMFHTMMLKLDERYLARTAVTTEDKSRAFMDAHSMADRDTDKRYDEMHAAKKGH